MILNFIEKVQITADCFSFFFDSPGKVIFKAGQHMNFTLLHDNPDDRGINRYFTIASAPHEEQIMITTRIAREQSSTFKKALMSMEKGQEISALPPQGKFIIEDYSKSYVFFAGGIGITPFRSMLVDLDYTGKIKEMEIQVPETSCTDIFIVQIGKDAKKLALNLIADLTEKNYHVSCAVGKDTLSSQLTVANKVKARFAIIIGQRELLDKTVIIKNMTDTTQETIELADIESYLNEKLINES